MHKHGANFLFVRCSLQDKWQCANPYHLFNALLGSHSVSWRICVKKNNFLLSHWANSAPFVCNYQLEKLINVNSSELDWERSFYLNLVAHTSYTVTVAICRYVSGSYAKILQSFVYSEQLTVIMHNKNQKPFLVIWWSKPSTILKWHFWSVGHSQLKTFIISHPLSKCDTQWFSCHLSSMWNAIPLFSYNV
jgi:hypothetical protein